MDADFPADAAKVKRQPAAACELPVLTRL